MSFDFGGDDTTNTTSFLGDNDVVKNFSSSSSSSSSNEKRKDEVVDKTHDEVDKSFKEEEENKKRSQELVSESEKLSLFYENHSLFDKQECRECGSTRVYTRIYFHPNTLHSRWLCYSCASDCLRYGGYRELTTTSEISPSLFQEKFPFFNPAPSYF